MTKTKKKKVKFKLVVTLKFDDKTSKKLKTHFNSKSDIGSCNIPNLKDFTKAYKNLMKEYTDSLPKAISPKIVSRDTQITSTVGNDGAGCDNQLCDCLGGGCVCKCTLV